MIRHCILGAAFISSLAAFAFAQTSVTLNVQVEGKQRAALLRVPAGLPEKPPVVFYVHGATDSGGWFQKMGNTNATADREKYIAIYACAEANCHSGVWQDMQGTSNFTYLFALLDSVDAKYKIDRSRVYMAGFSQGGFISFAAACFYSDRFAAVAPVSGHVNASATCAIKRPVPVFLTWGTQEGAAGFLKDRDQWLKLNKCPTTGTMTKPYPASNSSSKAARVAYGPCEDNTSVVIDSIGNHGHWWPTESNRSQSDEIWNFLKQYSLKTTSDLHPQTGAKPRVPITVAYASGVIRVEGILEEARVDVTDTQGKRIATETTRHRQFAFKGESGGVYLVTVRAGGNTSAQKIIIP